MMRLGCLAGVLALLVYFWSDFCLWRADANMGQRKHAVAARWVERSQWFGREVDARTCLLQLRIARRLEQFGEVERKLQQAVQLGAPRLEIQRERWLAMAQTSQFGSMQAHWSALLRDPRDDGPEIARAYYTWAMLHHNLDQARQTLRLWHEDYPRDPEPLALTGRFYQSLYNWEGAEEAYRKAMELAPGDDELRLSLANVLVERLKTAEAVPLYEDYLRRHPDDLPAVQGLAQCAATNGDLKSSIRMLREALERHPDDFATLKTYGEVLLSAGEAAAAVPVLEKAYRTVPEHANLANTLARALKACGRGAEAEPLFAFVAESRPRLDELLDLEKQLQRQPESLETRMKIASITATYVSRRDAIRWYENLLLVAPNYLPAHEALVDLYRQTGDERRAESHAGFVRRDVPSTSSDVARPMPTAAPSPGTTPGAR